MSGKMLHEALTGSIIGAFYEVYNTLGFGYLEAIYVAALEMELRDRGHEVTRELAVRVRYKSRDLGFSGWTW
jgi:GxxExxY protein